ncbi:MAG: LysR family transcriptional regulator, transcription activator of glutamate synthase operon [Alphaproteobacteria bacterium]|nr:LysR family transcriptional regulator, transcription activator of glutamate synthase operon [Alphaproteobacteria bacterium]
MTLHQLRIFLAVAHSATLTRASKQLGLAQPSLSKQLAALEESVGTRLFDRGHNRMVLTDAGHLLLRHAQSVLKEIDEAEAGLREFTAGNRAVIRIAGLNSVIKALLPDALKRCGGPSSGLEVDIHEAAPGEVIEMLYARQAHIGLIAAGTVAQSSVGFRQLPIVEDPYVFAVPSAIDLRSVKDIDSAPADVRRVLNSCIQFHFGTQHTLRVQQWYQRVLPFHRLVAHCRTYEVALGLVRAGFGVSLVPALTAYLVEGSLEGIELFATDHGTRNTVAILPDQYLRLAPYKGFVEALELAGRNVRLPPISPMPRLIERAIEPAQTA